MDQQYRVVYKFIYSYLYTAIIPQFASRAFLETRHAKGFPFVTTGTASKDLGRHEEYFHLG
jgi:hypothetical protein